MRLLLDTHVLIDLSHERLNSGLRSQLIAPEAQLHVSVASLWEIAIKVRLGKLALRIAVQALPEFVEAMGATLVPINASHALKVANPEPATRDPFDRLLLAHCEVYALRLVTARR